MYLNIIAEKDEEIFLIRKRLFISYRFLLLVRAAELVGDVCAIKGLVEQLRKCESLNRTVMGMLNGWGSIELTPGLAYKCLIKKISKRKADVIEELEATRTSKKEHAEFLAMAKTLLSDRRIKTSNLRIAGLSA